MSKGNSSENSLENTSAAVSVRAPFLFFPRVSLRFAGCFVRKKVRQDERG